MTATHEAAARGVAWLVARQDRRGRWLDYDDAGPGASTEWVTALVGATLAQTTLPEARAAAARAWSWLRASRPWQGGWGWSRLLPHDADSTAWGILLAEALGERRLAWSRAQRALAAHVGPDGSVRTFHARALRPFRGALRAASVDGWTSAHACVAALVANVPGAPASVRARLRGTQDPSGAWRAHWWPSDEYATALAAEALGPDAGRAGDWLATRLEPDGAVRIEDEPSAFATAWTARGLTAAGRAVDAARAAAWLALQQEPDGSWPASAWMRIVPPEVVEPAKVDGWTRGLGAPGGVIVDTRRHVTTAAAVGALLRVGP